MNIPYFYLCRPTRVINLENRLKVVSELVPIYISHRHSLVFLCGPIVRPLTSNCLIIPSRGSVRAPLIMFPWSWSRWRRRERSYQKSSNKSTVVTLFQKISNSKTSPELLNLCPI